MTPKYVTIERAAELTGYSPLLADRAGFEPALQPRISWALRPMLRLCADSERVSRWKIYRSMWWWWMDTRLIAERSRFRKTER